MGHNAGNDDGTSRAPHISVPGLPALSALPCVSLRYPALPCLGLLCLSFSILYKEIMQISYYWVYPGSHEERPNKGTGFHEEHASQQRPTTHPPPGAPLYVPCILL